MGNINKIIFALMLLLATYIFSISLIYNYQGVFTDSTGRGQSLKDSLKFVLYNTPSGTSELWKETHYVESANGFFSVNLGFKNVISPAILFSNDSLYIEISKGPQKGKRIRINSVMYATRAVLADSAVSTQRSESSRFSEASLFSDSTKASYRAKTSVTAQKADTSEFSKTSAFSDSTNKSYRALTAGIADSAIKTGGQIWSKKNITAYYNDGNLGIGTDSAKEKLDVVGNIMAENPSGDANMFLVASSNPALCLKQKSGSNILNRAKLVYSNNALYLNLWDSMGVQESPGVVVFRQKDVVLDAKGTIKAVNFMVDNVTLNVPDYVFDSGYNLKPLDDVENYINVNHHLPGLPGADEIKKNGMDLTQMNLKLLEKIEELTLHVINQNKKIIKLEKAVQGKQDQ